MNLPHVRSKGSWVTKLFLTDEAWGLSVGELVILVYMDPHPHVTFKMLETVDAEEGFT
jgi:hypothetical protein